MKKPISIIHVSDLHFINNQSILKGLKENGTLLTKRHLGWLNYKIRRQRHFRESIKERLLATAEATEWDYLIITGDLTTLALESEFLSARNRLEPFIKRKTVLLTTGNHDRYVKTAPESNLLSHTFKDCWPYNQAESEPLASRFLEIGDDAVILNLETAIPRPFFSSRGRLLSDLAPVEKILKKTYKNRLKIAIGHYPAFLPAGEHEGFFHSLAGRERLKRFLLECDFRFYLHGHIHKSWMFNPVEGKNLTCINSGGCCRHESGKWSGFHKISISGGHADGERIQLR